MDDLKEKWDLVVKQANGRKEVYLEDIVNVVGASGFYALLENKMIEAIEPLPTDEIQRVRYEIKNYYHIVF